MAVRNPSTPRSPNGGSLRSELLERLQVGLEPSWPAIAELLRTSFEGDHCLVTLQNAPGSYESLASSGLSNEWALRYEERFAEMNPYLSEAKRRRSEGGEPFISSADALVPFPRVRETAYYREFIAPNGLNDSIGMVLYEGPRPIGHLAIRRNSTRNRYGRDEEQKLAEVADVLNAGFARTWHARDCMARVAALNHLTGSERAGLILFDTRGAILDTAGTGNAALEQHSERLAMAVRALGASGTDARGSLNNVGSVGTLSYRLVRVPTMDRARILCILRPAESANGEPEVAVPTNVHFTAREREVLPLLAKGMDNLSMARALGIGLYTTKDHVKSIFRKLNVHTRAEAVALLARGGNPRVEPEMAAGAE